MHEEHGCRRVEELSLAENLWIVGVIGVVNILGYERNTWFAVSRQGWAWILLDVTISIIICWFAVCLFETMPHCTVPVGFEPAILFPQPPKGLDYRCAPSHLSFGYYWWNKPCVQEYNNMWRPCNPLIPRAYGPMGWCITKQKTTQITWEHLGEDKWRLGVIMYMRLFSHHCSPSP